MLGELNPIRYRGYYYDSETGYYFLQSRYYSPEWRRFINADSTFVAGEDMLNGSNMYAYCNGNPVMMADPSGRGVAWNWFMGTKVGQWLAPVIDPVVEFIGEVFAFVGEAISGFDTVFTGIITLAYEARGWALTAASGLDVLRTFAINTRDFFNIISPLAVLAGDYRLPFEAQTEAGKLLVGLGNFALFMVPVVTGGIILAAEATIAVCDIMIPACYELYDMFDNWGRKYLGLGYEPSDFEIRTNDDTGDGNNNGQSQAPGLQPRASAIPTKDTHNAESINADLRHYIPVLARRSRCFSRSLETLQAVVEVFVDAYNAFGIAKLKHRVPTQHKSLERPIHLHKFRDPTCSILDFL